MEVRNALYLLAMFGYCLVAYFFVKRFAHHIWSYFLVGLLYIPFFVYIGLKMYVVWLLDLCTLLCYAIFVAGVLLLLICAKVCWNHFKILRTFFVGFAVILLAISLEAFVIEPHWLSVRRETMSTNKISKPIKIAVIADIQTDDVGSYERDVLTRVKQYNPDLLLFAGDYIQLFDKNREHQHALLNQILKDLNFQPPLGTYVARGDADGPEDWAKCFDGLPFHVIDKSSTIKGDDITLTMLSLADSRYPQYLPPQSDNFHIVLGHAPDYALKNPPADLLIAGHTHGGQVQLPVFGPPITLSRVPRKWGGGCWTDIGKGTMLCVSRGVGMERGLAPRLRFLCRPEIVFIDVMPATTKTLQTSLNQTEN